MQKRYQVFISSTFRDLVQERQAVLQAVLELGHMAAGMELFPAASESAWSVIEKVIEDSDYYLLIVGGRYGSLDETGIGYTEKEYNYAVSLKKPILPILHKNPDSLSRALTETNPKAWSKLEAFRSKISKRHFHGTWETVEELRSRTMAALHSAIEKSPAKGWIRGSIGDADTVSKDAIVKLAFSKTIEVTLSFAAEKTDETDSIVSRSRIESTLKLPLSAIAEALFPLLVSDRSFAEIESELHLAFQRKAEMGFKRAPRKKDAVLSAFTFSHGTAANALLALYDLGLVKHIEVTGKGSSQHMRFALSSLGLSVAAKYSVYPG